MILIFSQREQRKEEEKTHRDLTSRSGITLVPTAENEFKLTNSLSKLDTLCH